MSNFQPLKGAPEHADVRLKRYLADGWKPVGVQHVMAVNSKTSDYSVLLRNGAGLALYTIISTGDRLYGSQLPLLTEDPA